jgi:hypothetical protein
MGRGSRPYESYVPKIRTIYPKTSAGGGAGSSPEIQKDSCLFSFPLKIEADTVDREFQVNDPVTLSPGNIDEIDIFIKGVRVSLYEGNLKKRLLGCMSNNYSYTGKVEAVESKNNTQEITASINGQGR